MLKVLKVIETFPMGAQLVPADGIRAWALDDSSSGGLQLIDFIGETISRNAGMIKVASAGRREKGGKVERGRVRPVKQPLGELNRNEESGYGD